MRLPLRNLSILPIITSLLLGVAPSSIAQTNLSHRYSFSDSAGSATFADSVGGANGSLVGTASLDGSSLQLDGIGGFATLPAGIITNYPAVSVEFWATFNGNNPAWTRTFAFGDQNGSVPLTSLDYTHFAGGNYQNLNLTTTNAGIYANNPAGLNGQTNVHVTVVVDPSSNRMFYYNGSTVASTFTSGAVPSLTGLHDTLNLIGKSLYDVDPLLQGSINELRIYQGAVSPSTVALNDASGPNNYITNTGSLLAIHFTSPANPLVVNQNSQQLFTGDFVNVTNLNLNTYGGATYTSGNTNVLSVNPTNGLVKANAIGTTTVIASYGALSATNTLTVVLVPAVLTHRYSFTTDASDSIGGANGTLMGAATISAGKAVLDGSAGTYVDLPGSLININTNSAVTIEAWVDFGNTPGWCRLFNFGNDGGSSEIYVAPNGPGNGSQHRISENIAGGQTIDWRGAWANVSLHVTFVIDPLTSTLAVYRDGVLEYARYDASAPLSLVSTNLAVIGRSLVGADPYMPGSIDEFRIYNGALTPQEIATTHKNGPNSISRDPGALASIRVPTNTYPAFSGVVPPVVLGIYANLTNFNFQPNNSAVISGLVVTSSDTNIVNVRANNMLQTFRPGTVTLTATYLGRSDSATIKVENLGALTHRYSFTSDASDSVGGSNGTLLGGATVSGGTLVLPGTDGSYLDLPPALLEGYDSVTVDTWVTFNAAATWARLWYFGDDRANELYLSPAFGTVNHTFRTGFPINGANRDNAPIWQNQTLHITCAYGNGFIGVYTNGVIHSSSSSTQGRLSQVGSSFSWIGRSPFADPFMNCSVDEFRLYKGRLAPDEILASDVLGTGQLLNTNSPIVKVSSAPGNVLLSWPVASAGFSVQTKSNLGSGSWLTLTNAPTLVSTNWQLSVATSTNAQFFRLWR